MVDLRAGFLTIGQSPRPDIMDEVRAALDPRVEPLEYGALDGMGPGDIAALAPRRGQEALVTRLADGTSVSVSGAGVRERLRQKLEEARADGCGICVLLCTGRFGDLGSRVPLITSDEVFHEATEFPESVKTLGVIVPLPEQAASFAGYYAAYGRRVLTGCASPYGDPEALWKEARRLRDLGADCLCLDCMGYTIEQGKQLRLLTGLPVKVPREEIAARINSLIPHP